jgi:hypothetical protein
MWLWGFVLYAILAGFMRSHIWVLAFIYTRIRFHLISWLLSSPLGKYGKYLLELDLISELGKVNVENMIVGKKIIKKE